MLISGETARYELTHLNLYCLQKAQYCLLALKELNSNGRIRSLRDVTS